MSNSHELSMLQELRKHSAVAAHSRIHELLDDNTFIETDTFLGIETPGEGVVTGFGFIASRPVFIYAHDFELLGGALGERQADKIVRLIEKAVSSGTPIVGILNSNGARLSEGLNAVSGYARIIKAAVAASGVVPHVIMIDGVASGAMALYAQCADAVIMNAEATLSVAPPSVAHSLKNSSASLKAGTTAIAAENKAEANTALKKILNYLPDNHLSPAYAEHRDDLNRLCPSFTSLAGTMFDVLDVMKEISDDRQFIELYKGFAPEMVVALASISGKSVGIIANNYSINSGRITANAAKKAARMIQLCDAFSLPIVTLADTDGFVMNEKAEEEGLAKDAAKLAFAYAESNVAKITVILTHAIGSGLLSMGSKGLGADAVYAWAGAEIGTMPVNAALNMMASDMLSAAENPIEERAELEKKYAQEHMSALAAAKNGTIDEPIDPAYTRMYIASALEVLHDKKQLPAKKNNMPI